MSSYEVGIDGALGARLWPGSDAEVWGVVVDAMPSGAPPGGCVDADMTPCPRLVT
jgi:hypothetical protein|tara:strand:- start:559 stop:723 length:165 start_codon:yes stop_codon:yes gene_type:complete